ncbi:MAG: tellurite resistance TerB family protein [Desmonostoc vinosum HA7617-LM4]|jgi:hypothetical protein|nr:tellurite resistance TerB family protein [Desmonostoc vinosum HA7617-LM4]
MGLLDTVLGTEKKAQETLSSAEAFAVIILGTTAADGYLSDDQANCISFLLSRMKLFKTYTHEMLNKLFDIILSILRQDGLNTLFDAAKESLSQDLREAAFVVATDLVLTEGILTEEENHFLNDLYLALDVSRDLAIQIVQIMLIKNRG